MIDSTPTETPTRRGRGRPAIGRNTPLTRDEIVERASAIVRTDGIDALSMRRLAADLGVTVKAIYNHMPDKSALLDALVARVWTEILSAMRPDPDDLADWLVDLNLRIRRVWLHNLELATMAMAVSEPDDNFIASMQLAAAITHAAGFPDVPLAYNVLQTYTMGSVAIAATRRRASTYFGRDPNNVLATATRALDQINATPDHRGVVEAQFDHGDDTHFEVGLRVLATALLQQRPEAVSRV